MQALAHRYIGYYQRHKVPVEQRPDAWAYELGPNFQDAGGLGLSTGAGGGMGMAKQPKAYNNAELQQLGRAHMEEHAPENVLLRRAPTVSFDNYRALLQVERNKQRIAADQEERELERAATAAGKKKKGGGSSDALGEGGGYTKMSDEERREQKKMEAALMKQTAKKLKQRQVAEVFGERVSDQVDPAYLRKKQEERMTYDRERRDVLLHRINEAKREDLHPALRALAKALEQKQMLERSVIKRKRAINALTAP